MSINDLHKRGHIHLLRIMFQEDLIILGANGAALRCYWNQWEK